MWKISNKNSAGDNTESELETESEEESDSPVQETLVEKTCEIKKRPKKSEIDENEPFKWGFSLSEVYRGAVKVKFWPKVFRITFYH